MVHWVPDIKNAGVRGSLVLRVAVDMGVWSELSWPIGLGSRSGNEDCDTPTSLEPQTRRRGRTLPCAGYKKR